LARQQEFTKTQKNKRQLSTGDTAALVLELKQIYLYKAKVHPQKGFKKTPKLKKEHYTGIQDLPFLLDSTEWRC
jgi:hypothetical protein